MDAILIKKGLNKNAIVDRKGVYCERMPFNHQSS